MRAEGRLGDSGRMFRRWLHSIAERIPSRCALCHGWPARPVCDTCVAQQAQPRARCGRCALPLASGTAVCGACLSEPPPLDSCIAAVDYAEPWSRLVIAFKFHGQPGWAGPLALLMRHAPWAEPALEQADRLLPVPLSRERLRQRGFNQALLLARALDARKADARSLLRIRDTPAQSGLTRAGRERNLRAALMVAPERAASLRGARILLIDDVMTTGTTLHAAARCLKAAGAAQVGALVFARVDVPQADGPLP